jgi:hypothetical protein
MATLYELRLLVLIWNELEYTGIFVSELYSENARVRRRRF